MRQWKSSGLGRKFLQTSLAFPRRGHGCGTPQCSWFRASCLSGLGRRRTWGLGEAFPGWRRKGSLSPKEHSGSEGAALFLMSRPPICAPQNEPRLRSQRKQVELAVCTFQLPSLWTLGCPSPFCGFPQPPAQQGHPWMSFHFSAPSTPHSSVSPGSCLVVDVALNWESRHPLYTYYPSPALLRDSVSSVTKTRPRTRLAWGVNRMKFIKRKRAETEIDKIPMLGVVIIFLHSLGCHGSRKPFWEKSPSVDLRHLVIYNCLILLAESRSLMFEVGSSSSSSPPSYNWMLTSGGVFHIFQAFVETNTKTVIQSCMA